MLATGGHSDVTATGTTHSQYLAASGELSNFRTIPLANDVRYRDGWEASDIVSHIATGKWTASQVLEAYIPRATLAQSKTNCLTEGASARPA